MSAESKEAPESFSSGAFTGKESFIESLKSDNLYNWAGNARICHYCYKILSDANDACNAEVEVTWHKDGIKIDNISLSPERNFGAACVTCEELFSFSEECEAARGAIKATLRTKFDASGPEICLKLKDVTPIRALFGFTLCSAEPSNREMICIYNMLESYEILSSESRSSYIKELKNNRLYEEHESYQILSSKGMFSYIKELQNDKSFRFEQGERMRKQPRLENNLKALVLEPGDKGEFDISRITAIIADIIYEVSKVERSKELPTLEEQWKAIRDEGGFVKRATFKLLLWRTCFVLVTMLLKKLSYTEEDKFSDDDDLKYDVKLAFLFLIRTRELIRESNTLPVKPLEKGLREYFEEYKIIKEKLENIDVEADVTILMKLTDMEDTLSEGNISTAKGTKNRSSCCTRKRVIVAVLILVVIIGAAVGTYYFIKDKVEGGSSIDKKALVSRARAVLAQADPEEVRRATEAVKSMSQEERVEALMRLT